MHFAMPQATPDHKRLHAMAGSWVSEETINPTPWDAKGGSAVGRSQSRVALDGLVVVTDYEQERDGKVGYRGHGVFGFDMQQKRPFMQWFDNMMSMASPAVWGTWEGDALTFQMQGPMGHSRYVYRFEDGAYGFEIGMSQDGKTWNTFMSGRFTRAGK